ncbi:MAG: 4-(cytidine 5'-diphospho)-2-C-methyl-D-erythritol kinase [Methylococcales bacterium]
MSEFPEAEGWSTWFAPAKINLFLQITGQRNDGYHLLQTVFQLLDWGDEVHLRLRDDAEIIRTGTNDYGVAESDDLIIRAAKILQLRAGIKQGAELAVSKNIPLGGGFGGGSSDAATVLLVLNSLWRAGLNLDELAELGLSLGADVPVFVRGHSAWAEGVGEKITAIELPKAAYLLVDSGVHVPTSKLFQTLELTRNAAPVTIADFVSGTVLGNAFEPVLRAREPIVDRLLDNLSKLGPASLTGTGGGCFARFNSLADAQAAHQHLPSGLSAWVANGVNSSPLLAELERWTNETGLVGASPSG